jgi:lactate dehydrogenase-like 2-hydroxyacid dehydrogenase
VNPTIKKKILVTAQVPRSGLAELEKRYEIIYPDRFQFTTGELKYHIKEADAVIPVFIIPFPGEVIREAEKLQIIANYGVGFNNIDLQTATSMGVVVCNTPNAVTEPAAEMAMGLLISLMRRITETDRKLRNDPNFKWGMMENLGHSLYGKTLGIVGLGRIGRAMARRAAASGMKIIYHNRTRLSQEKESQFNAVYTPFAELISRSDIISLHCPLTPGTHHILNEEEMKSMKDGVFIINTARGAVINEKALVKYLKTGKIGGAGLDVFEEEPKIEEELLLMDNVVLTPHNATGTIDTRIELAREASQNIIDFFDGKRNISIVNPEVWK